MKDEIKVLYYFKSNDIHLVDKDGYEKSQMKNDLLDYIINLQRERDNFKTALDESQEVFNDYKKENENYKSRIEKIKNTINKLKEEQSKIKTYSQDYDKGRLMGLIWALRILTNEEVE